LPGFGLSLGFSLSYLGLVVLIPLALVFVRLAGTTPQEMWRLLSAPRVLAACKLTFGLSALAGVINGFLGLLVAWTLTRYRFWGRRFLEASVDLPFAMPTAVAGIALTTLYAPNGWVGRLLDP
jgi:sulfate transport system permease protein